MGTHSLKGLELVFFGSGGENVVKKSTAPVLTIKREYLYPEPVLLTSLRDLFG
jgi:hypothetical protein